MLLDKWVVMGGNELYHSDYKNRKDINPKNFSGNANMYYGLNFYCGRIPKGYKLISIEQLLNNKIISNYYFY